MAARKAMLGHKIRRLRRDREVTQAQLAERLGISASYLNLIESNQRPVTVEILLKLGQIFDLDLASFAEDEGERLVGGLSEVFGDPLFATPRPGTAGLKRQDIIDLAAQAPAAAEAVLALYQAYREGRETLRLLAEQRSAPDGALAESASPLDEVRDWVQAHGHHFPELETAAEEIWQAGAIEPGALFPGLIRYLDEELTLRVKVMPVEVMGPVRRRYDRHGRRILLSEMLPLPSRSFHLAVQIALIKYRALLDEMVAPVGFSGPAASRLGRIVLANYLAGAVMMPYDRFWRAATALRYDIEVLQSRFEASFEQVSVRLTTLQRQGAKGVPFFLIRSDKAGNVSKRLGATNSAFARMGGACPLWILPDAFRSPGRVQTQVAELPDGSRWFTIARTVSKPGAGFRAQGQSFALALGCEIAHAAQLVYADGIDLASDEAAAPIGLHCRLCERPDCDQRAFPPLNHVLSVDENLRGATPYQFTPAA
ncbi:short-chain fatty acyl-CoA regulator family protein [Inquilinus sp. OTU3971]|uniref:short-chain fatty acyl-CoA regulator family protein n=1 Tax=Inquilinus sp. OTU3971 TaxID=3043855 RepID=UPI00313D8127